MHVVNVLLAVTVAPIAVFVAIDIYFKHFRLSNLILCLRQCDHSYAISLRIHCDDDAVDGILLILVGPLALQTQLSITVG